MAESKNRKHALLRVEPRNYEAMIDKLQDMNINHRRESDTVIKLYTDGISDKVLYNLTHDVYVDKFVLKEEIKSTLNEGRYENIEHMFSGEPDPMGKGDESYEEIRGDVLATIDELNQFLNGNVTAEGLKDALENMIYKL